MKLQTDVLVIGGGTGGMMAAIGAAEEGAKVVLAERDNALGGTGIRAGIHYYYYGIAGGAQDRIDDATKAIHRKFGGRSKGFHPELKGMAVERRVAELGIVVLYEAILSEMLMDGSRVVGAIVETGEDRVEIAARVTIDATGMGDAACMAGVPCTTGREWDGVLHNYSLAPRYVDENNRLDFRSFDVGWVDATDVRDMSRAYRKGRQLSWRENEDPSNTHFTVVGPMLGVREGRTVIGEHLLHQDDLLLDKRFDDVVLRCSSHHDNHAFDYANESDLSQIYVAVLGLRPLAFGGEVPYRSLVPKDVDGMLLGSRSFSQDHDCSVTMRMQRDVHKLGEAAGVAAALSVKESVAPRHVPIRKLQERLVARGVLKREDLQRESEPWIKFKDDAPGERRRMLQQGVQRADIEALIGKLQGTDLGATRPCSDTGKALWWLWHFGDASVPALLDALETSEGGKRMSIAFALGILKHPAAEPELAEVFRRHDNVPEHTESVRAEPYWISALILLKGMRSPIVADDVVQQLGTERMSTKLLFMLHYLNAVADRLTAEQKSRTISAVEQLLRDPELGDDYTVWNLEIRQVNSMDWGLELAAAYLLERIGGNGRVIFERYAQDERGFARNAAKVIASRLPAEKGAVTS
ncbi:MAG: hypothetical protein K0Q59_1029 [Paenibacillus sp.]|jgi:hypothetical protein|nr:hypothetical protein [Paenibacillus sp.]